MNLYVSCAIMRLVIDCLSQPLEGISSAVSIFFCKAVDEPLSKVSNVSQGYCAHLKLERAGHFFIFHRRKTNEEDCISAVGPVSNSLGYISP